MEAGSLQRIVKGTRYIVLSVLLELSNRRYLNIMVSLAIALIRQVLARFATARDQDRICCWKSSNLYFGKNGQLPVSIYFHIS